MLCTGQLLCCVLSNSNKALKKILIRHVLICPVTIKKKANFAIVHRDFVVLVVGDRTKLFLGEDTLKI